MTIYLPSNSNTSLQDNVIYGQEDLGLFVSRTQCLTKESRSLRPIFHGSVTLSNILYSVGYMKMVLISQ